MSEEASPTKRAKVEQAPQPATPSGTMHRPRSETDEKLEEFSVKWVGTRASIDMTDVKPKVSGSDVIFNDNGVCLKLNVQELMMFPPGVDDNGQPTSDTFDAVCTVSPEEFSRWKQLIHRDVAAAIVDAGSSKIRDLTVAKPGLKPVLARKVGQTVADILKKKGASSKQDAINYLVSCFENPKGTEVAYNPIKNRELEDGTEKPSIAFKWRPFKRMAPGKEPLTAVFLKTLPRPLQELADKCVGDKYDKFFYNDLKTFDCNGQRVNFTSLPSRKGRIGLNGAVVFLYIKGMLPGKLPFTLVSPQEVHVLACQEGEGGEEKALGSNGLFA